MFRIEKPAQIILIFLFVFFMDKEIAMAKAKEIKLPVPIETGKMSVEEAILSRRSERDFINKDLDLVTIGQLLWSAQGITAKRLGYSFRAAPSAGALYPMEIYLLNKDGFFHYVPAGHKLQVLGDVDLRVSLASACLGQASVREAAVDIVICAVYQRITRRYGERGIKYTHIEAGHIAQNVHLQAVALGLGSVPIGAFDDQQVSEVLSLPDEQEPVYIIPVGYID
jgi:SagB-type dehydrogenase family enzyme